MDVAPPGPPRRPRLAQLLALLAGVALLLLVALRMDATPGRTAGVDVRPAPPATAAPPPPTPTAAKPPRARAAEVPAAESVTVAPSAAATPATSHPIRCVVVASDGGAPVEGADVLFVASNAVFDRGHVRGTTGADGSAVIDVPDDLVWRAVIRKAGLHTERRTYVPRATDLRVEMKPAIHVEGRVVLADTREPVPGVAVRAWTQNQKYGIDEEVGAPRTTDADGRFVIDDAPDDAPCRIYAVRSGFRTVEAVVTRTGPGPEVELVLGEGGILEGSVFDVAGRPLPGADVFLIPPGIDIPDPAWAADEVNVGSRVVRGFIFPPIRTDASGRYAFRGVRLPIDGAPQPRLAAARDAEGHEARSEPATFSRHGERMTRDVRFLGPPRLTVRVVAASPPTDVWEIRAQRSGGEIDVTRPLAPGSASVDFGELRPGRYFVSVGREVAYFAGEWEITRLVDLPAGTALDLDLPLDLPGSVEGVLVDDDGAPVAGIPVVFTSTDETTETTVQSGTRSGKDGSFAIGQVLPNRGYLKVGAHVGVMDPFAGRGSGRRFAEVELRDILPGGPPLRITLHGRCRITGRARPVPRDLELHGLIAKDAGGISTGAKTDDDGRFSFTPDFAGDGVLLVLEQDGFAPFVIDDRRLPPGGTLDLGDVVFTEGLAFETLLRDTDDKPLAHADVWATDPWFDRSLACDAEGRIRPVHLPDRPFHLMVAATATTADWRLTLDPKHPPTSLVIGRGVAVEGRVLSADDTPAGVVEVQFVPAVRERGVSERRTRATTAPDGRFSVRLQPGRWTATAGPGDAAAVEFEAGDATPALELRLR